MFKQLMARIGFPESPFPWSLQSALFTIVMAFVAVFLSSAVVLSVAENQQYTYLAVWSLGCAVAAAYAWFSARLPEKRLALRFEVNSLPMQNTLFLLFIGVGLAVALDVVTGRVTNTFFPEPELFNAYFFHTAFQEPMTLVTWLLAFLLMVILQPLSEELIFRGIALPALRRTFGAWPGYLLSALLYGLFHLFIYANSVDSFAALWYSFISPVIAGLIFAAVRLYTGSTWAAVLTHAAFGLFALVKLLTLVG